MFCAHSSLILKIDHYFLYAGFTYSPVKSLSGNWSIDDSFINLFSSQGSLLSSCFLIALYSAIWIFFKDEILMTSWWKMLIEQYVYVFEIVHSSCWCIFIRNCWKTWLSVSCWCYVQYSVLLVVILKYYVICHAWPPTAIGLS